MFSCKEQKPIPRSPSQTGLFQGSIRTQCWKDVGLIESSSPDSHSSTLWFSVFFPSGFIYLFIYYISFTCTKHCNRHLVVLYARFSLGTIAFYPLTDSFLVFFSWLHHLWEGLVILQPSSLLLSVSLSLVSLAQWA